MPAPSSYTEGTLAAYMAATLGAGGAALGVTAGSAAVVQAVYDIERLLGVSDVATYTDMAVLEAAARWYAWRVAVAAALAEPSKLKSDGDELDYSQRLQGLRDSLAVAEADYYRAVGAAQAADTPGVGFFFGIACGGRGR